MAGYFKYIIIILGFIAVYSCSLPDTVPEGRYFNITPGFSTEFEVQETRYSLADGEEKRTYFLKEEVGDEIEKINGFPVYALLRYIKTTGSWQLDSVWTTWAQPDKYVKVENNLPIIKIQLPVKNGTKWDGNALNHLGEAIYRMRSFDDKLEITHRYDSTALELHVSREIYQRGVGMIYKEITNYQYCQATPDCIGKGIVTSGLSTIYKTISLPE